MHYEIVEEYYGPQVRFHDWARDEGEPGWAGGALHLDGRDRCGVTWRFYPYGGGGDVEYTACVSCDRMEPDGVFTVHWNAVLRDGVERGFRFILSEKELRVFLRDEEVARADLPDGCVGHEHELRLVTLGESWSAWYDRHMIGSGRMEPPFNDNEGTAVLVAEKCDMRLLAFTERFVAARSSFPEWERVDLLYEEAFGEASFEANWICNRVDEDTGPEFVDGAFHFRHMCNNILRPRFDGPLAVDFRAAPMPAPERFRAGVTDAIFIWMLDTAGVDIETYFDEQSKAGVCNLAALNPLDLYWVDFGGTDDVTTRLRKNPQRHMVRQYTDRLRLLKRHHTYNVTVTQMEDVAEFFVDGDPVIQFVDPTPLTSGHVGVRAFCSDIRIEELRVHRIKKVDS